MDNICMHICDSQERGIVEHHIPSWPSHDFYVDLAQAPLAEQRSPFDSVSIFSRTSGGERRNYHRSTRPTVTNNPSSARQAHGRNHLQARCRTSSRRNIHRWHLLRRHKRAARTTYTQGLSLFMYNYHKSNLLALDVALNHWIVRFAITMMGSCLC